MTRSSSIQNAFNSGEWSGRMAGRTDLPAYAAACEILENFQITAEGPAEHSGGTVFIAATKFPLKKSRLISFKFSTVQAYILEVGDQYIRFYKDYGQIVTGSPAAAVEIATPYLEADLAALMVTQSADVLYITHVGYAPRKLTRTSHVDWTLSVVNFTPPATAEDGYTPTGILVTLGAVSGTGVSATAGSAVFLAKDVGRTFRVGLGGTGGLATITAFTSTTVVTVDIINTFPNVAVTAGTWTLDGAPVALLTPGAASPIGATTTLTLDGAGWRATDVGRYVKVSGGFLRITGFTSTTVVNARILRDLDGVTAAAGGTWELRDPAWSAAKGYPSSCTFFQQRLWLGGTTAQPTTFWGSVSTDFENFALGGDDNAACEFTLDTDEVNAIQWMKGQRALAIGTTGGEFIATGAQAKPSITPDNIQVVPQSARGSAKIQALLIGDILMFLQRSRRKLRQYKYSFEQDKYASPEVTLKARHITCSARPGVEGGIIDMAYQQEPEGILWCVRNDGQLIGLTFDADQEVEGWQRRVLGGTFGAESKAGANDNWAVCESVACISSPDGGMDDPWLQVKRTIGGATVRTVEVKRSGLGPEDEQEDAYFVDCGLTYDGSTGPVTEIDGLDHLIGQEVAVCADGGAHPRRTVDATGKIQLAGTFQGPVHVGLYRSGRCRPMRLETPGPDGTSQGKDQRIESVITRFDRSLGGKVYAVRDGANGPELGAYEQIVARTAAMPLGTAPQLFTGDREVKNDGGWNTRAQVEIVQDEPLPMTICAVMLNVVVNKK